MPENIKTLFVIVLSLFFQPNVFAEEQAQPKKQYKHYIVDKNGSLDSRSVLTK